jgi:outer membrane protein
MLKLGTILLVILGLALSPLWAGAAEVKIGTINTQDILTKSPEFKRAQDSLKRKAEEMSRPLQLRREDIGRQIQEFEKQAGIMKEDARKRKQEELQKKMSDLEKQAADAQKQLAQFEQNEKAPIFKKLEEAIKAVAQENKLDVVLDTVNPVVLYANPSLDITEKVRSRYH